MKHLDTRTRNALEAGSFAFALQRKEPIENASHVRNAIARRFHVEVHEASWRDLAGGGLERGRSPARQGRSEDLLVEAVDITSLMIRSFVIVPVGALPRSALRVAAALLRAPLRRFPVVGRCRTSVLSLRGMR